jgi:hypothetical protein
MFTGSFPLQHAIIFEHNFMMSSLDTHHHTIHTDNENDLSDAETMLAFSDNEE